MSVAQHPIDLGRRQDRRTFRWASLVLLTPSWALLGFLFLLPIGYAVYLGFTNLELVGLHSQLYSYTGLANLRRMSHDTVFWHSVRITIVFLLGSAIVGQSVAGMALALMMRRSLASIRISVGILVIAAWVLPEITAALIWYAFSQAHGTLSIVLGRSSTNFLVAHPLLIVSVANLWRNVAFSMLVFSAGLRTVPNELLEAAELEGASAMRRLRSVTLPILRPTIVTNLPNQALQIFWGCEAMSSHQGGGNHVFVDGHSKWIARNSERYLLQDQQGCWYKKFYTIDR